MTALDDIVAKFRASSPNIAAAFDEVQHRLVALEPQGRLWVRQPPFAPVTVVTNASGLGLNVNNQQNVAFRDYAIDGTGDSGILLQGTTSGCTLSRMQLKRVASTSSVSWAKHGVYCKARGNQFSDLLAENGGNATSGLSVRMGNNTFTRTVIAGFTHAFTYYEHDGQPGTVTVKDADWTFTGDTVIWGDDSNEPPAPYIKQAFVFDNVKATGPGSFFLKFGPSTAGGTSYRGAGVTLKGCTLNGKPVTAAMVSGVPSPLLHIV